MICHLGSEIICLRNIQPDKHVFPGRYCARHSKLDPTIQLWNICWLVTQYRLFFGCLLNMIVIVQHKKQDKYGWLWLLHIGMVHILHNTIWSVFCSLGMLGDHQINPENRLFYIFFSVSPIHILCDH